MSDNIKDKTTDVAYLILAVIECVAVFYYGKSGVKGHGVPKNLRLYRS